VATGGGWFELTLNSVLPGTAIAPLTVWRLQLRSCPNSRTKHGSSCMGLPTLVRLYAGSRLASSASGVCGDKQGGELSISR